MSDPLTFALETWQWAGQLRVGMATTYSGPGLAVVEEITDPSAEMGEGFIDVRIRDTFAADYTPENCRATRTIRAVRPTTEAREPQSDE
jgi:hypothetical protein